MRKLSPVTLIAFAFILSALTVHADVTPTDVKNGAEEKRQTIEKNTRQAGKKLTTEKNTDPRPAPKRRKSIFDTEALHKDRSLPADDKVPMTDDKPHPRKSLSEQLHKDRSNDK